MSQPAAPAADQGTQMMVDHLKQGQALLHELTQELWLLVRSQKYGSASYIALEKLRNDVAAQVATAEHFLTAFASEHLPAADAR